MVLTSRRRGENMGVDSRSCVASWAMDWRLFGQPVCSRIGGIDYIHPNFEGFRRAGLGLDLRLVNGDLARTLFEFVAIQLANMAFAVGFGGVLDSVVEPLVLVREARPSGEDFYRRQVLTAVLSGLAPDLDHHPRPVPIYRLGIYCCRLRSSCPACDTH